MSLFAFVRQHSRPLAFGLLHGFYSAPGQTFVIGIFVAAFSDSLGITPATIGALYLGGTLAAAVTLILVGHLIDRIRLIHFSAAVIVALAGACFVAAAARGPATLGLAIYLLRLTGQSLMVHVEATATARAFDRERGRALGITALGIPLSQVVFPPAAVAGIAAVGWRWTYATFGAVALLVLLPLTQWLLAGIARAPRVAGSGAGAWRQLGQGLALLARSRYVWLALPAFAVMPFCGTAVMFHVTSIAEARGWPLTLVAMSFPTIAVTAVASLFVAGHFIDRWSARKLFLVRSLPIIAGMIVLAVFTGPWALFVGFACIGVSTGLWSPTQTAMWAELFGTDVLGTIRAAATMYMVSATAVAPFAFGAGLEAGWSVSEVLLACAVGAMVVAVPPVFAESRALA